MGMQYWEPEPLSREEEEAGLHSDDPSVICETLVSCAYYDDDWRWVQERCLEFMHHWNRQVRYVAIICLGHLVRIHGVLDLDRVQPALKEMVKGSEPDPDILDAVLSARSDIRIFYKGPEAAK